MLEKCVLTILELNWNQRLGHKKTKLNICHHMLTLSTQLQNRSFHIVEKSRTSSKCQKMRNKWAERAKILFFTVKYANLWGFCCRRRGFLSSLVSYKVVDNYETARLITAWTTSMLNCWPTKILQQLIVPGTTFVIENLIVISSTLLRMELSYSSYLVGQSTHAQVLKTCDKIQRWEDANSPFVLR